ncbi:helix-turn-helix domain-containing protein [Kallotenue papyrolyticum]|uniref:helix-turn-helix domain-containing protein n=1 Tax=Kallotenue papyrolyticum TaxID=1325125 RepID=UPI0004B4528E|nr:helix-turn-helix domain-containing protein [Kallotenue papyrolyticum]
MSVTIRDLLRLALPPGSTLRTSDEGLHQHVAGVVALRATLPAFPQLRGGELALVGLEQALRLDERLTLPTLIRRLAAVSVPAIAVAGTVEEDALQLAARLNVVLVQLPDEADLRQIERDVQRLLVDPETQLERRAAQLYTALTQQVAANAGVEAMLRLVVAYTGNAVALFSNAGELRSVQGPRALRAALGLVQPPFTPSPTGPALYALPVGQPTAMLGTVVIAGTTLDAWDELAAQQAAAALALELSKQQAVQQAEARVRGDILRTILSGTVSDPRALQEQAAELGYDLRRPHVALMIMEADHHRVPAELHALLQRLLVRRRVAAPTLVRDTAVLCLYPADDQAPPPNAVLEALAEQRAIAAGISTPAATFAQWPRACEEAEQALLLGRQLFGPRSITAYNDLGVYRLLLELRASSELHTFYWQTLGALIEHDRATNGELIRTLEGYFAALGNLHQAAEALHIHRNTLIYRLRRIGEISGLSLKRAEDVLALQIALKAHRVLSMQQNEAERRNRQVAPVVAERVPPRAAK